MSERPDQEPRTGNSKRLFEATRWSVVLRAREESTAALNELFTQYRHPLLTYLRARGYNPDDVEDLVQGFCAHLLRRDFLANVAPEGGLFRTFLLNSLRNYLCDQHDKKNALKRGKGQEIESLDKTNEDGKPVPLPPSDAPSADEEYDRAWAHTVLANAMHRVEQECAATGHLALVHALEPALFADETSPSYRDIAAQLGMTEGAVKTAAHRIRTRLKGAIREEILHTVNNARDWEREIRCLISLFSR
jgi:RNA polymerase sigma factor (sigma-70 family)